MIAIWDTAKNRLEFPAPLAVTNAHVVLILEHSQTRTVMLKLRIDDNGDEGKGTVIKLFTNCTGIPAAQFKDHDFFVTPEPGETYFIEVMFADADCSSGTEPNTVPLLRQRFGGPSSAGAHAVEQWRFSDAFNEPVCGITILVIDDIVGPDASKMPLVHTIQNHDAAVRP